MGHDHFAESGGLMSYGVSVDDLYIRSAGYIDQILRGASVSEMPVQAPTKFQFVINMKSAKKLGLEVPYSLIGQADEIIE
ncbi:ABC transporter substrate binding protein [Alsobacter sp. SYSU BS001988]